MRFYRNVSYTTVADYDYDLGDKPDKATMDKDRARVRDEDDFFSADQADPLGFNEQLFGLSWQKLNCVLV